MVLIKPCRKYLNSYKEAFLENKEACTRHDFIDPDKYDIFEYVKNYEKGINIPANHVKASFFWLVEDEDFIGEISIRHALTPFLLNYGGHIGYGIRPSKWNKGYGTVMLSLALEYAKKLNLDKVLITCDDDNIASSRVIEKNGGILENKITNIINDNKILTRRYWINLKE